MEVVTGAKVDAAMVPAWIRKTVQYLPEDSSSKELPNDIIYAILLKVPIKTLMRFQTVSKNWLTMIHSNPFARPFTCPRSHRTSFFVLRGLEDFTTRIVPISVLGGGEGEIINRSPQIDVQRHLGETRGKFLLFPAGHGFLALFKSVEGEFAESLNKTKAISGDVVSLWNPTTNQNKVLPLSPYYSYGFVHYLGFATVVQCKDGTFSYKVGRVTHPPCRPQSLSLELYSSKTNSWKFIPNFFTSESYNYLYGEAGSVFHCANLNGKVHWVIPTSGDMYITAFDYETEVFTRIKGPKVPHGYYSYNYLSYFSHKSTYIVTLFDDKFLCLGLSTEPTTEDRQFFLDIWVLRQYEDENSWVKEFTFGPLRFLTEVLGFSSKVQGVFLRDESFSPAHLTFCDCNSSKSTTRIQMVNRGERLDHMQVVEHFGSLVTL